MSDNIQKEFVKAMEVRLKELNISHYRLAKMSGVSKGNISKIFHREANMTMETMVKLAHAVMMKVEIKLEENNL